MPKRASSHPVLFARVSMRLSVSLYLHSVAIQRFPCTGIEPALWTLPDLEPKPEEPSDKHTWCESRSIDPLARYLEWSHQLSCTWVSPRKMNAISYGATSVYPPVPARHPSRRMCSQRLRIGRAPRAPEVEFERWTPLPQPLGAGGTPENFCP